HRGERIDAEREVEDEIARRDPGIERLLHRAPGGGEARHLPHDRDRHRERRQHDERREAAGDGLRQAAAHRRGDGEAEQREERNESDHHHFSDVNASGLSDSRWRNRPITTASPTAASAAATVMTKNVMICPSTLPCARPNATNDRLTAFSMISIDRRMVIRLRRRNTPAVPIANRTADTTR